MATPTVYVICDQNCKFEGMTKEQILTAITQAVQSGEISDVDTGFVQTIKTINGRALKFFVGEQAEFEALSAEEKRDLFALITNDTTKAGIYEILNSLTEWARQITDGSAVVPKAYSASSLSVDPINLIQLLGGAEYKKGTFYIDKDDTLEHWAEIMPEGVYVLKVEYSSKEKTAATDDVKIITQLVAVRYGNTSHRVNETPIIDFVTNASAALDGELNVSFSITDSGANYYRAFMHRII